MRRSRRRATPPRWRGLALAALAAAWWLAPVTSHRVHASERLSLASFAASDARAWASALRKLAQGGGALETLPGAEVYRAAQAAIPRGARVVSTGEQAYLWDYARNRIHSLDFLGQASPEPGMPFFAGADAVAEYLLGLGYTHLAFTPPRRSLCLYSAEHWRANLHKGQWMWRRWAPYFLDFMRTQRELARTRAVVYRASGLVVVDLRRRAPPP